MKRFLFMRCVLALGSMLAGTAGASVIINGTRVVYPAGEREVSVKLTNDGASPALVQSWVDSGDPKQSPDRSDAPFLLTPPVARIEPSKGQTLRLLFTGAQLPGDRESVFWLNVLEVPPSPTAGDARNYLQLAFRSRIKIFFRPQGLRGRAADAPQQLHWRLVPAANGQGVALECTNPTPYHVSFSSAGIVVGVHRFRHEQGGMVAPMGKLEFSLPGLSDRPANADVEFSAINDYGGTVDLKGKLDP